MISNRWILLVILAASFSEHAYAEHFLVKQPERRHELLEKILVDCRSIVKEVPAGSYVVRATTFRGSCNVGSLGNIAALYSVQRVDTAYPEAVEVVTSSDQDDLKGGFSEMLNFAERNNEEFSAMWESTLASQKNDDEGLNRKDLPARLRVRRRCHTRKPSIKCPIIGIRIQRTPNRHGTE